MPRKAAIYRAARRQPEEATAREADFVESSVATDPTQEQGPREKGTIEEPQQAKAQEQTEPKKETAQESPENAVATKETDKKAPSESNATMTPTLSMGDIDDTPVSSTASQEMPQDQQTVKRSRTRSEDSIMGPPSGPELQQRMRDKSLSVEEVWTQSVLETKEKYLRQWFKTLTDEEVKSCKRARRKYKSKIYKRDSRWRAKSSMGTLTRSLRESNLLYQKAYALLVRKKLIDAHSHDFPDPKQLKLKQKEALEAAQSVAAHEDDAREQGQQQVFQQFVPIVQQAQGQQQLPMYSWMLPSMPMGPPGQGLGPPQAYAPSALPSALFAPFPANGTYQQQDPATHRHKRSRHRHASTNRDEEIDDRDGRFASRDKSGERSAARRVASSIDAIDSSSSSTSRRNRRRPQRVNSDLREQKSTKEDRTQKAATATINGPEDDPFGDADDDDGDDQPAKKPKQTGLSLPTNLQPHMFSQAFQTPSGWMLLNPNAVSSLPATLPHQGTPLQYYPQHLLNGAPQGQYFIGGAYAPVQPLVPSDDEGPDRSRPRKTRKERRSASSSESEDDGGHHNGSRDHGRNDSDRAEP